MFNCENIKKMQGERETVFSTKNRYFSRIENWTLYWIDFKKNKEFSIDDEQGRWNNFYLGVVARNNTDFKSLTPT